MAEVKHRLEVRKTSRVYWGLVSRRLENNQVKKSSLRIRDKQRRKEEGI